MIEQRARVKRVEGNRVWVQTETQTGCHSCGARSGCGSALIAQMFPARFNQQLQIPLSQDHTTPPRIGDHVVLGIDEAYLQKVSLLLYAVPLLGLLAGAVAGQFLTGTEPGAMVAGLSGLCLALLSVKWGARRLLGLTSSAVRILRVERSQAAVSVDSLGLSSGA